MHRPLVLSLVSLVLASCQLSDDCGDDIACPQQVNVGFDREISESGLYRVQLDWEGKTASCEAALPPAKSAAPVMCGPIEILYGPSSETDGVTTLSRFIFSVTSPSITIALSRDGVPLVSQTVAPSYEVSTPEGPECGTCQRGSAELKVPPIAVQ